MCALKKDLFAFFLVEGRGRGLGMGEERSLGGSWTKNSYERNKTIKFKGNELERQWQRRHQRLRESTMEVPRRHGVQGGIEAAEHKQGSIASKTHSRRTNQERTETDTLHSSCR